MSETVKNMQRENPDALIVVTASLLGANDVAEKNLTENQTPHLSILGGPYQEEFRTLYLQLADELGLEMAEEFLVNMDARLVKGFREQAESRIGKENHGRPVLQRDAQLYLTRCEDCECFLRKLKKIEVLF